MPFPNSFPPKLDVILLRGAEAPPAPMVETPMDMNIKSHPYAMSLDYFEEI